MKRAKIILSWLLALLLVLNPLFGGLADLSGASAEGEETEFQQNNDAEESSGEETDGEESEGEESSGEESEGEESSGEESDGEESDGEESDGEESDGEESSDEESDGEESDGEESDGEESDGEESDGEESDGEESDGEESDGEESDGEESDGEESDGEESESEESDSEEFDEDEDEEEELVSAAGVTTTVSTKSEFNTAANNGGSIILGADITLNLDWGKDFNKDLTIDLNGKTITVVATGEGYTDFKLHQALTIRDSGSGGKISIPITRSGQECGISLFYDTATLTLESGTLEFTGVYNGVYNKGIDLATGTFTMTGGTITSSGTAINRNGGSAVISGGTLNAGFTDSNGSMTITGGSFSFDPSAYLASGYATTKTGDYWVVEALPPVAEVDGTNYTSLAAALSAWTDGTTLKLLDDVTTASTITVSGTKTLDLNGHGIRMTQTQTNLFVINSGDSLTLNDSDPTATHRFTPPSGGAGLATLNETDGTLTIQGGYITGFQGIVNDRYAIRVNEGGTFIMNGGTFIGNRGGSTGSAQSMVIKSNGRVVINGGAIKYNHSEFWGTAVNGQNLEMNGGEISHNTCGHTGAVHVHNLVMSGGSIRDNKNTSESGVAGICVYSSAQLSGNPVITGNTDSSGQPRNLYLTADSTGKCSVTAALGDSADIHVFLESNTGVFTNSSDTSLNDASYFTSDNSSYAAGKNADGQLYLGTPLTVTYATDYGTAPEAQTIAAGLHTLPAALSAEGWIFGGWSDGTSTHDAGAEVTVNANTTFTALWLSPVAEVDGAVYASFSAAASAWSSAANGATLKLLADVESASGYGINGTKTLDLNGYGIKITSSNDRVFTVRANASVTINDSDPTRAHAVTLTNYRGTAVADGTGTTSVTNGTGTVYITGGYITGGTSAWGSAIAANGTLTINGGTILGNTSSNSGAIRANSAGVVILNGGQIIYNRSSTSATEGGAVNGEAGGTIYFSGSVVVKNNYDANGNARNVNLRSGTVPKVTAALSDSAEIGITMQNPGVFTSSTDTSLNDGSKFVSDNASYLVGQNADGQLLLGAPVTASYATEHGTAPEAETVASGSLYTLPAAPTASGWAFNGWSDGTNTHDAEAEVTVSANASFTAMWTAVAATAPTISAQPQALGLTYGYESGSVSVTAEAAEGHTVSVYQWYANTANSSEGGTAISGATDASYDIPTGKSAGTAEYYYCVVTATRTDNGETASTTSAVAALTVGRAAATVNADFMHKAYGDTDPTLTATVTGLKNGDAASVIRYTLERAGGEEIGLYTIFPSGEAVQGNYTVSYELGALTIDRAAVTVTANSKSKTYGDDDPTFTASVTGLKNGDSASLISYTLSRAGGENAGDYAITPSGEAVQGNYNVRFVSGRLTVNKATPEYEIPTGLTATYGDTLSDVTMPTGWSWVASGEREVGSAGTHSFTATFTPADTRNYRNVYRILKLAVEKAAPDEGERPEEVETFEFDGEAHVLAAEGSTEHGVYCYRLGEDGDWSETPPEAEKADTYTVYFYLKGDANHLDLGSEDAPLGSFELTVSPRMTTQVEGGSGESAVAVEGLDELADALQKEMGASDVSVQMTVERRTEAEGGEDAAAIRTQLAENQDMDVFEIDIEAMVDSASKLVTDTGTVLKIVVPYSFTGKENPAVYHCHDGVVRTLTESDSEEDGTCQLDIEGGTVTIYSSLFSAYAVGYTQLYTFTGSIHYGDYTGPVTVSLLNSDGVEAAQAAVTLSGGLGVYQFIHIPKGSYLLSAEWTENDEPLSLEETIEVR